MLTHKPFDRENHCLRVQAKSTRDKMVLQKPVRQSYMCTKITRICLSRREQTKRTVKLGDECGRILRSDTESEYD